MEDKVLYKIGEVAKMVGVEPHVIRYWEKELPFIVPGIRGKGGQRLYTAEDVERLVKIKKMLYEEGFRIEGVRKIFEGKEKDMKQILHIKRELLAIKDLLDKI